MNRHIRSVEDVLSMLDSPFEPAADRWTGQAADWWDAFYADHTRQVPFFAAKPDESPAAHLAEGLLGAPNRALDLGGGGWWRSAAHRRG